MTPGRVVGRTGRRERGALLVEALVALAIVTASALAWLHVQRDAGTLAAAARAQQAGAQALRQLLEGAGTAPATAAGGGAVTVDAGMARDVGPWTVETTPSVAWTDADGRPRRLSMAVQRFSPHPSWWRAPITGPGPAGPTLLGPGGRHPALRAAWSLGLAAEPTVPPQPVSPRPGPAPTDPVRPPSPVVVPEIPPAARTVVRQLSGVLRTVDAVRSDPVLSEAVRRWLSAPPAAGGACRVVPVAQASDDGPGADVPALGPVVAAWACVATVGAADTIAAPGSTWVALAALLATRPDGVAVCRVVEVEGDAVAAPAPPPPSAAGAPAWALLDASTPARRVHLVLAPGPDGCPAGSEAVSTGTGDPAG